MERFTLKCYLVKIAESIQKLMPLESFMAKKCIIEVRTHKIRRNCY